MSIKPQFYLFHGFGFIKRFMGMVWLILGCCLFYSSAHAESCWVSGGTLNLGTVNAQGSSTVSTDITVNCNSNWSQPVAYNMCMVVDSMDPSGNDPRSMISYNTYPAPLLNYNLYYDAARTRKIPASEAKASAQCQSFQVSENSGNPSTLIKIYGQVLAGQNVAAGYYKTNNMSLKLLYAYRYGTQFPTDLETLASQNTANNYMLVQANYENSCLIVSASDIDFGAVERINNILVRSGTIQLACPNGTNMKVSLDNGLNFSGSQRRMKNASGRYIQYNLYQDASHVTAWQGNTLYSISNPAIPVYAVISPQNTDSAGQYSDTITVTLTY